MSASAWLLMVVVCAGVALVLTVGVFCARRWAAPAPGGHCQFQPARCRHTCLTPVKCGRAHTQQPGALRIVHTTIPPRTPRP